MTKKKSNKKLKIILVSVTAVLVCALCVCLSWKYIFVDDPVETALENGGISVHFIDVGQADCILFMTPEGNMLVDAGTSSSESELASYLDEYEITSFEYLVLTHPHDDHIGGADMILKNYEVKNVVMTDAEDDAEVYYSVMSEINDRDVNVMYPESGDVFSLGGLESTVLAPNKDTDEYEESNSTSLVLKCEFEGNSVLLTGDAETDSEYEMIEKYGDALDCDILKLGHHGSKTSSSYKFLEATSPQIAIACCGKDNTYGHPNAEVMYRLEEFGIELCRTDKEGSIVYICVQNGFERVKKD